MRKVLAILLALIFVGCVSARNSARKAEIDPPITVLPPSGGISVNGIRLGDKVSKISETINRDKFSLDLGEISMLKNLDTGNTVVSLTVEEGSVTGFLSERESAVFIDKEFLFGLNSPATRLSRLESIFVKRVDGLLYFERDGERLQVFVRDSTVKRFQYYVTAQSTLEN